MAAPLDGEQIEKEKKEEEISTCVRKWSTLRSSIYELIEDEQIKI